MNLTARRESVQLIGIRTILDSDKNAIHQLLEELWGSGEMVLSTGTYHLEALPGFLAEEKGTIIGFLTYAIHGQSLEIISLNALCPNKGIGSQLLQAVEEKARQMGKETVELVTTNDNLDAIAFYRKRGYHHICTYPDAVTKARQRKPSIPMTAENGIPIRDELLFAKK